MSRPVKTSQGSSHPTAKNSGPHNSQSLPHASQSPPPKGAHSMTHGDQQPMPPHSSQTMPRGTQSPVPREQQPMHEAYSMPYGGYSMPHQGGYPLGYGAPPPMSHGGFGMNSEPQSGNRGMYPMYSSSSSTSPGSQSDNKNKMRTLTKAQRENLSRSAGAKTGSSSSSSYQRGCAVPEINRMTMDYEGRFIDPRGRVVDYSRNMGGRSSRNEDPTGYMFVSGRDIDLDIPREEPPVLYDYGGMPGYLYDNLLDTPDLIMDMEMPGGRYPPYFGRYSEDDDYSYNGGLMAKMMPMPQGYMDASGSYSSADFQDMPFPDGRRMESAGRYGDSFDR